MSRMSPVPFFRLPKSGIGEVVIGVPERAGLSSIAFIACAAVLVPVVMPRASKLFALTGVSTTEAAADGADEDGAGRPAARTPRGCCGG